MGYDTVQNGMVADGFVAVAQFAGLCYYLMSHHCRQMCVTHLPITSTLVLLSWLEPVLVVCVSP